MIKIEKTKVYGFEEAIRGMRNPMNSWDKSDSDYRLILAARCDDCKVFKNCEFDACEECEVNKILASNPDGYLVGPNDHELMMKLVKAGTDHRKFLRMITVTCDITSPLYWWKEMDTYKIGTVSNSCSTMHKIAYKEFTLNDFSHEHLITTDIDTENPRIVKMSMLSTLEGVICQLNYCREKYLETNDKIWWWQMIQLLPSSYNQKRTLMLNYEVIANMRKSRKNHKLDEWRDLITYFDKNLPYPELFTLED